jgi:hypothetical protein
VGERERVKGSMINDPRHTCLGLFGPWMAGNRETERKCGLYAAGRCGMSESAS